MTDNMQLLTALGGIALVAVVLYFGYLKPQMETNEIANEIGTQAMMQGRDGVAAKAEFRRCVAIEHLNGLCGMRSVPKD